jgi:23S rRNA pseudouridine1911/1915/1917 synthase
MLDILHEDDHCLAVNKPAGWLTTGRPGGEESLESRVRAYLATGTGLDPFVGTVHRLDRPVSGVVVWAQNPRAARRLSSQFAARHVAKVYLAVVAGRPSADQGTWEDWLDETDARHGIVRVGPAASPGSRRAVTSFRVEAAGHLPPATSLVRLRPETGRTHQLRVQAASRGLPILGDRDYGSAMGFPIGIALHARSLDVTHPITGRPMSFHAEIPALWREAGIQE